MKNIDFGSIFFYIALAVGVSSLASCAEAIHIEKEKTIQLKLQLEHNAKIK
jgi:hypothetical protein